MNKKIKYGLIGIVIGLLLSLLPPLSLLSFGMLALVSWTGIFSESFGRNSGAIGIAMIVLGGLWGLLIGMGVGFLRETHHTTIGGQVSERKLTWLKYGLVSLAITLVIAVIVMGIGLLAGEGGMGLAVLSPFIAFASVPLFFIGAFIGWLADKNRQ